VLRRFPHISRDRPRPPAVLTPNCRSALSLKYSKRAEVRSDRGRQAWVGEGLAVIPVIVRVVPVIGPEGQEMVSGERDCGDGVTCAGP
jgi:hypothetical protein